MLNSGIYKIENNITNDFYIGSATSFYVRKSSHWSYLRNNKHGNLHLQRAVNKYGLSNFSFEELIKCPKQYLLKAEQWFINNLKPSYNICLVAGSNYNRKFTDEHKKRISISNTGKIRTEEQIENLRNAKLGHKHKEESLKKLSQSISNIKGNRKGDKITREEIINFCNIANSSYNNNTIKSICNKNNFNYRSILKFISNNTWKELYNNLSLEAINSFKNPSLTKKKN